jgi:hypothetical protein
VAAVSLRLNFSTPAKRPIAYSTTADRPTRSRLKLLDLAQAKKPRPWPRPANVDLEASQPSINRLATAK